MTEPPPSEPPPSEPTPSEPASRRYGPDRLIFLVDGIFAISMTLLALEVRIGDDVPDTAAGFADAAPDFFGRYGVFIAAFLITSRFWLVSHRQMATLHHVDNGTIERTVLFLAGITSLPVATGVLFRYGHVPEAVTFASLVLAATGLCSARLWWYISSPRRDLADVTPHDRREVMVRSLLVVVAYLLAIPLAFALEPSDNSALATLSWLLLAVVDPMAVRLHALISRRYPVPAEKARA